MQIVTEILGRYKANENGGLGRREGESGLVFGNGLLRFRRNPQQKVSFEKDLNFVLQCTLEGIEELCIQESGP